MSSNTLTHARTDPRHILGGNPVIAVLRARDAAEYAPVIDALVTGGVHAIELTLSTVGTIDALPGLLARFGSAASIGVGTVTTGEQATAALERGARFLVTPTLELDVVDAAVAAGVPVFPGGLTPTELYRGWSAGASAVKVFPASAVGPGYLGQLRGPFPDLRVVPSGGVGVDDAAAWIAAGAVAVSVGGPLLRDAFADGGLAALTDRCRNLTTVVGNALEQRKVI